MTPRLVGYFLGTIAASALFGAAIASAIEWILARFTVRGPRAIAISCIAAFIPLSALLMNDPKLGLMAPPAVALGCCMNSGDTIPISHPSTPSRSISRHPNQPSF